MSELEKEERKKDEELFKLILKKTGMTYKEFLFLVKHNYVACNLDVLSDEERNKFSINVA